MKTTDVFTALMLLMFMDSMIDIEPSERVFLYICIITLYFIDFLGNTFRHYKIVDKLKSIEDKLNELSKKE